jgi:protein SCO1/2
MVDSQGKSSRLGHSDLLFISDHRLGIHYTNCFFSHENEENVINRKKMKTIIQYLLFLVTGCLVFIFPGMQPVYAQNQEEIPEVSIRERLGEIIPLELTFMNEQGQPVQLKDLIHKPTILTPVYFDCPGICPRLLSGVSDVIERSDMTLGNEFQVITFSFNENDTPEHAAERKKTFLRKKSLPHEKDWIYLTGDSLTIHTLTNALGYYYQRAGNDFLHPAGIIILSPEGKITRYLYGTSYLPFDLKMAIIEAQKGQARPTINRVLEYCFTYDPEGRKYTLQVTKVSATIIIFFSIVLFIFLIVRSRGKQAKSKPDGMQN